MGEIALFCYLQCFVLGYFKILQIWQYSSSENSSGGVSTKLKLLERGINPGSISAVSTRKVIWVDKRMRPMIDAHKVLVESMNMQKYSKVNHVHSISKNVVKSCL